LSTEKTEDGNLRCMSYLFVSAHTVSQKLVATSFIAWPPIFIMFHLRLTQNHLKQNWFIS